MRLGELIAQTFWNSPSQMHGAEARDTGDLDVKSCSAADLLSHLGWPSRGSKECVGTARLGRLDLESQGSLSTLSSLEKTLILHNLNTTKNPPNTSVYATKISAFSPSAKTPCKGHGFGGEGKYLSKAVNLQSLRSFLCPLPSLRAGGCHAGESLTPGQSPDSDKQSVTSEPTRRSNPFREVTLTFFFG